VALLVVYVVFVAYGSFFPFNFAYDPHAMDRLLDSPLPRLHDAAGRRLVSLPDLVSNVLLGVPVGILMIWSGLAGRGLLTRVAAVVALDAGGGTAHRRADRHDVQPRHATLPPRRRLRRELSRVLLPR